MDEIESLIFRTDRIGDFIISFPFIQSFKDNFPKTSISIVSSQYNSQFIKKFQFISNTIPLQSKLKLIPKIIILIKMIFLLRKKKYNHIIILDGKMRSFFISLFLKSKNKSILLQSKKIKLLSKFFNYKTVLNTEIQPQTKNFSFLANILGFKINNKNPNIYKDHNLDNKFLLERKFIVLHLDEKWFSKLYYSDFTDINPSVDEIELFIKKISNIFNNNYEVILTSGNRKIDNLINYISTFKKIDDFIFKKNIDNQTITYLHGISFEDLAFTVSNSVLVVCCEGAISHLSNNFKIPTLALYEKKRFQHTKFWTGHMKKIKLFERKKMNDLLLDKSLFNEIENLINLKTR